MQGTIFNIQKFSLHDGPGIRTVVFLKGCPLRCLWCSNPESQRMEPELMNGAASGAARTVEDVLSVCLQDRVFYEESGGGVTLSGGEPMMQPAFALALLAALRAEGIHTAIETTGYAPPAAFEPMMSAADLLLFDVKHWSDERHIQGTGVSNAPILENLRRAVRQGCDVLPRIPVIPGYNDAVADACGLARALKRAGAVRAQLLPFHQLGEKKYHQLGRQYAYAAAAQLRESDLQAYRGALMDEGIDAFF